MRSVVKPADDPLELQAEVLAQSSRIDELQPRRPDILRRLDAVRAWFDETLQLCREPPAGFEIAARWILDNDYQVVRALRHIDKDLPVNYFKQLPRMVDPAHEHMPQTYRLVHVLLKETRLQLTYERLTQFVSAYQRHAVLAEAELWAIPALLRIACLENLVCGSTQLLGDASLPFDSNHIIDEGICLDATERVSGAVASFSFIEQVDWHDFVVEMSHIEACLQSDPANVYASMSRPSRNVYRREVEALARHSPHTEVAVAAQLIALADQQDDDRTRHIGYWLFSSGRAHLNSKLQYRKTLRDRYLAFISRFSGFLYVFMLAAVTLAALLVPLLYLQFVETGPFLSIIIIVLSLVPAIDIAVQLVHGWAPRFVPRRELLALDRHAVQFDTCQCAVVVPIIVNSAGEVDRIIEKLELRYLANTEKYLRFVLLSDLADASEERTPADQKIEASLVAGIRGLNERYRNYSSKSSSTTKTAGTDRFLLLHRSRQFNPAEGCWMGWERKRGKLEQFNSLLVDGWNDVFELVEGDMDQLSGLKYVISLDADTMLPPGTAADLVCTFEHPLNQPIWDADTGKLSAGYSLLQPRIESLDMRESSSRFAHLFSGDSAIDIYSHAVSDFHQDWFGTGSYVGKGIYHVRSFHQSTLGRVPENRILSHDLFEGMHGRVALASNIVLYESFPETWAEHSARRHRWIRGDWQLLPWLGRFVPGGSHVLIDSVFDTLDRWKLLDNLRRSVIPPVLLVYLIGAWTWFPGNALFWTALALGAFAPYLVNETLKGLALVSHRKATRGYLHELKEQASRWAISVALIVPDAMISLDAIFKALWRQNVSGRNLLQWKASAHASETVHRNSFRWSIGHIVWLSPATAVLTAGWLWHKYPSNLVIAIPVLLTWSFVPWLVNWLSAPRLFRRDSLTVNDCAFLRRAARRTWHYFDTFTGPEENWLPPDNYQAHAGVGIAHRTSTTNIGLYLSSAVAACDLGFIGLPELAVRADNVLDTLQQLPAHRGQLLNWYDTRTLAPLEPRYISTVDNGNLAICLIALKQGCLELADASVLSTSRWQGLSDTLSLLREQLNKLDQPLSPDVHEQLIKLESRLIALSKDTGKMGISVFTSRTFADWSVTAQSLNRELVRNSEDSTNDIEHIRNWMERFDHQLYTLFRDVHHLLPWLQSLDSVPACCRSAAEELMASLREGYPLARYLVSHDALLAVVDASEASLLSQSEPDAAALQWLRQVREQLLTACEHQRELRERLKTAAARANRFAWSMDFSWLYDKRSRLFHIGYNVTSGLLDTNHYDLLASEARLASFFAIAKHDVPMEHWFYLGRPVVRLDGVPVLQSWNGSLFEYLMPPLFLPGKRDTLIGESESLAVKLQQRHGEKQKMPWGVSESAFSVTDAEANFQYKAFGTPALGIRRGLADDHVVAPYASMLALGVWPQAAVNNLRMLESLNALGDYGYIDALDFTQERLHPSLRFRSVDTWMAHHQGMSMVAMLNVLNADLMPRRVLREPALNAVELLLQERIPWNAPTETGRIAEIHDTDSSVGGTQLLNPWIPASGHGMPQLHLLGNGRLSAHISHFGGGGLYYRDLALTRLSNDCTQAHAGYRIHMRVVDSSQQCWLGDIHNLQDASKAAVTFTQHSVEIVQRVREMTVRLELIIAPDDDMDVRRVTIVNEGAHERQLVLTSYAEVVLARVADDIRHPAFSKMFVGSSEERELGGVSFFRRARDTDDDTPMLLHRMVSDDAGVALSGWETDRHQWFDRSDLPRTLWNVPESLSGTTGFTLDPIMALQATVRLAAGETKRLSFVTSAGKNRQELVQMSKRFGMPALDRLFTDVPWAAAQEIRRLGLKDEALPQLQSLASLILYPQAALRSVPPLQVSLHAPLHTSTHTSVLPEQPELWRFGLSGDLPLLLVRVHDVAETDLLEHLIRAQALWRRRGMQLDIGVLRLNQAGYEDPLRERVMEVLRDTHHTGWLGRRGGIHLLPSDQVSQRSLDIVLSAAAVVLDTDRSLHERLSDVLTTPDRPPYLTVTDRVGYEMIHAVRKPTDLLFDNGIGGFDPSSSDYVIQLEPGVSTPAPWCNVLANKRIGCLVSENGLGFTWAQNSGEHRLTPWSNDPVLDRQGEQLWLRDETNGDIWSVSPNNRATESAIQVRHGFGYTCWLKNSHGLEQEQMVFVPVDDPVKIIRLRLFNRTDKPRRLTATFYAEWVMEAMADTARTHVNCHYDPEAQAIMARNHWHPEFASAVAFVTGLSPPHSVCGDRSEFLNLDNPFGIPEALLRSDLGGSFTSGSDCCAAYQIHIDIPPNEKSEVSFLLGEGRDQAEAAALISRWRSPQQLTDAFSDLADYWNRMCGAVKVSSPDPAFDLMINGWLLYQCISSRLHARAGFYQAGGAFGFRDQLQDVLACIPSDPQRVRNQILRAAEHQFEEGDVLHWWHPPAGRGVRTRISDDYLWLAYVTARYVNATGDLAVLDVQVPYLSAPLLEDDEDDRYTSYGKGSSGSLFDHCCRAIVHGMRTGAHGLPLMGSGDWNDGMDRIGREGRGESVWLAWFQIATIRLMTPVALSRKEAEKVAHWQRHADALKHSIDTYGWDGQWFARAFDDAGIPWGSVANDECQIDVIAQAWGVLAGFGDESRVISALQAADDRLVDRRQQIVRLLTPPFHDTQRNPGYIKAYPPGIRENGGQYTHAAAWLGLAFSGIGDTGNAYDVFNMINPINHAKDRDSAQRFAREPYVLSADIGGAGLQEGRGGWSWYTGAASWTWQLGVHGILGIEYLPGAIKLNPGIPVHWDHVEIMLNCGRSMLSVRIENQEKVGRGITAITVDGVAVNSNVIRFPEETGQRRVVVRLGHDCQDWEK